MVQRFRLVGPVLFQDQHIPASNLAVRWHRDIAPAWGAASGSERNALSWFIPYVDTLTDLDVDWLATAGFPTQEAAAAVRQVWLTEDGTQPIDSAEAFWAVMQVLRLERQSAYETYEWALRRGIKKGKRRARRQFVKQQLNVVGLLN